MGIGLDLGIEEGSFGIDNREWLGTALGTQSTRSATIDCDDFIGVNIGGAVLADGDFLPSGVLLGIITASPDKVVRSMAGAADGSETGVGYLYSGVKLKAGRKLGIAVYDTGKVRASKLPANSGTGTTPPQIIRLP